MKEQILKLRAEGKTYREIILLTGASRGTVSYHCGPNQKQKTLNRSRNNRSTKIRKQCDAFTRRELTRGTYKFQYLTDSKDRFNFKDVLEKFGDSPICYLSGRPLKYNDGTLSFDHIIPASKGGSNNLDNLGLTHRAANQAKHTLSVEEFIQLCKEVLEHNGYEVKYGR